MALMDLTDGPVISPDKLAVELRTTKREIGETIGIAPESLSRKARIASAATQTSLRHLVEILNAVTPTFGNLVMAFAWFRSEPIVGFGGRTPEQIVKDGEFDALRAHIQRRLAGGYA
ncbi:MAG: hypothetical protein AAF414_13610 [Pseudomonadota bacterium]